MHVHAPAYSDVSSLSAVRGIAPAAKRFFLYFKCLISGFSCYIRLLNKSSTVAEMGDRLATIDMGRKWGAVRRLKAELGPI